MERRTEVGGTADRSGWNGGPKWWVAVRKSRRFCLCLSALSQENDLIFARKRGQLLGDFERKKRGFAQQNPRFLRSPRGD